MKTYTRYSDKELISSAVKYRTWSEFLKNDNKKYDAVRRRGLREEIQKAYDSYLIEDVYSSALKYQTKVEFRKNDSYLYRKAIALGIIEKACSHMVSGYIKYSDSDILLEAKKYNNISEFIKNNNGMYQASLARNLRDDIQKTYDEILATEIYSVSKKYNGRKEFRINEGRIFRSAEKLEILDKACSHMPEPMRWTYKKAKQEALKYTTRSEFSVSGAYGYGKRNNVLDDLCSHMEVVKNKQYSYDELKKEALKYNTKGDFKKNSRAYATVVGRGLLGKLCSHMSNNKSGFDYNKPAFLYYLKINNGEAYKIGVTNRTVEERYSAENLVSIEVIFCNKFDTGLEAIAEEKKILNKNKHLKYEGKKILLHGGDTELFSEDIF